MFHLYQRLPGFFNMSSSSALTRATTGSYAWATEQLESRIRPGEVLDAGPPVRREAHRGYPSQNLLPAGQSHILVWTCCPVATEVEPVSSERTIVDQPIPQSESQQAILGLQSEIRQHYATTADLHALETRLVKEMGRQVKWLFGFQLLGVTAVATIMGALAAIMKL